MSTKGDLYMVRIKKNHTPGFKFKIALASIKGDLTFQELSQKYKVHASQISKWKAELLEHGSDIFEKNSSGNTQEKVLQEENQELYEKIGKMSVELDFLKKTLNL